MINEFGIPQDETSDPYAEELVGKTRTFKTPRQQVRLVKRVKKKIEKKGRKERIKKSQTRYDKSQELIRKAKGRISKPKQPKFSKALLGLTKSFMPDGAEFESVSQTGGKKRVKYGRGRPTGTYKKRYVPGYGVVEVPTHIYNRMMAEAKAKSRLAAAKRQAQYQQQMEAEQIAMSQDPRFQSSGEDAWADSEDMEHEENLARVKQQQVMQEQMRRQGQMQPSLLRRGVRGVAERAKLSLMGSGRERFTEQPIDPYARPQINKDLHRPREPRVSAIGGKTQLFGRGQTIMNQRNEIF